MKILAVIILGFLFFMGSSCKNESSNQELAELKTEIQLLKDSIKGFELYYHFRAMKPIVYSNDKSYEIGKEYRFICSMAAFQFFREGNLIDMQVEGKSTLGNSIEFDTTAYGEIIMNYTPKHSGSDTLMLDFNFLKDGYRNGLSLPLEKEILVLDN